MDLSITIIEGNVQIAPESEIRIAINDKLSYVFNVHQANKTFTVPPHAFIKLRLADPSSSSPYGSVSISSSLFPLSESFWLPLLSCPNDTVEELPYDYLAKLWIQLSPVTESLMPILEASEKSDSAESEFDDCLQTELERNSSLGKRIVVMEKQLEDMFLHSEELSKLLSKTIADKEELELLVKKYKNDLTLKDARLKEQDDEITKLRALVIRNRNSSELRYTKSTKSIHPTNQKTKTHINSELDRKIKQKLNEIGKPGLMKKERENVYVLGKKKIFVELRAGNLVWKVDGKVKSFEELVFPKRAVSRSISSRRPSNTQAILNRTFAVPPKANNNSAEVKTELLMPHRERKTKA